MRVFITLLLLLGFQLVSAQNLRIAQSYYDNGELEKALISFEELYKKNKANSQAIIGLAKCYRQLERYQDAENLLTKSFKANNTRAEYLLESAVTNNIAKCANAIYFQFYLSPSLAQNGRVYQRMPSSSSRPICSVLKLPLTFPFLTCRCQSNHLPSLIPFSSYDVGKLQ